MNRQSGHITLPYSYALYVTKEEERDQLVRFLKLAIQGEKSAAVETEALMERSGVGQYMLTAAWLERQKAYEALATISLDYSEIRSFVDILERTMPQLPKIELGSFWDGQGVTR